MPGGLEKLHGLSPFRAWCLSSSLLISPSLRLSVFFHPLLSYLLRLALSVHPPSLMSFSLSFASLSIAGCHSCSVAFFTLLPCDMPLFQFLRPLSSFLPLLLLPFLSVCCPHHTAGTPYAAHA